MRWKEIVGLAGPILLLGALSLYGLGALSFWRDEVASVVFASGSLVDLLTIVGRNRDEVGLANMATYYLVLHFWLGISQDETWVRLLSVLFGVASVVPVYFIARRLAGWAAGAVAAAIFALIPFVVHYNQEARGYSLSMLVAGALTWLVLVGTERRATLPWLAYGMVAALGIYVHFFVALVVAAHGLWLLATRQVPHWRGALSALLPIAAAAAPIPFIILEYGSEQEWIPPLTADVARTALVGLAGGVPLLLAMTALLGYGLARLSADRRAWLLVASVLVPIVGGAAISLVKPMFVGRYLIMVLPALAVFVAWTIVTVRPPLVAGGMAAGLALLLILALPSAYADPNQQDWRAAGQWVAADARVGDAMIAQNGRRSLEYYTAHAGGVVPASTRVAVALEDSAMERVWVAVLGDQPAGYEPDVPRRLSAAYDVADRRSFGAKLSILLMTLRPLEEAAG